MVGFRSIAQIYKESEMYKSKHGDSGLKCIYEAAREGLLFPLEKSFLFVHQPCLHIHYKNVSPPLFGVWFPAVPGFCVRDPRVGF